MPRGNKETPLCLRARQLSDKRKNGTAGRGGWASGRMGGSSGTRLQPRLVATAHRAALKQLARCHPGGPAGGARRSSVPVHRSTALAGGVAQLQLATARSGTAPR